MAVKTIYCNLDVSVASNPSYAGNAYNQADRLSFGQGSGGLASDGYFALLGFEGLGIPANQKIDSAVLTVTKRTGPTGSVAGFNARAIRITGAWSESTSYNTRPGTTTAGASPSVAVGEGHAGSVNIDVTEIVRAWYAGQPQYGVWLEKTSGETGIRLKNIYDRTSGSKAYITITYSTAAPILPPSAPGVHPATTRYPRNTYGISWDASIDPNGYAIEYVIWRGVWDGSNYQATYTTVSGAFGYYGWDISGYPDGQRLYMQVQARNSHGATSTWAGTGDPVYRYITPSAPASINLSKTAPYEGEEITVTLGRPSTYNPSRGNGNDQYFTYRARRGTSAPDLASGTAPATETSKALTVTIGDITTDRNDLPTEIRGYVTDGDGYTSPYSAGASLTIKRYRAPIASAAKYNRAATNAEVHVRVSDTGYGGTQSTSQIDKIQYRINNGGWVNASVLWSGLTARFTIPDLSADTRYTLDVRAINVSPPGTTLPSKTGGYSRSAILEYVPALAVLRDSITGQSVVCAQTIYAGDDFSADVPPGEISVGGNIVWHAGNLGKTVLWSGALASGSVSIPAMLGYRAYQVRIGAGSYPVYVPVLRSPSTYCYGVNFDTNDSVMVIFTLDSSGTLNIVRIKTMTHTPSGSHSALSDGTMTEIIGLW